MKLINKSELFNSEEINLFDRDIVEEIKQNSFSIIIPQNFEYRPDLISLKYLKTHKGSWLIDLINNNQEGIKFYKSKKRILVPNFEYLEEKGYIMYETNDEFE